MFVHLPSPRTLSRWPGIDPSRGLVRKGPHLAGSEDSEERVEEGGHQGRSSERHCLGHPVHSGHDQHVSTRRLLEGDERGQSVTGVATGPENPDETQDRGSGHWDAALAGARRALAGVWRGRVGPRHRCVKEWLLLAEQMPGTWFALAGTAVAPALLGHHSAAGS